jgi:hypothetical protein
MKAIRSDDKRKAQIQSKKHFTNIFGDLDLLIHL